MEKSDILSSPVKSGELESDIMWLPRLGYKGHAASTLLHGTPVNRALNCPESLLTQGCQNEETQVLQKSSV